MEAVNSLADMAIEQMKIVAVLFCCSLLLRACLLQLKQAHVKNLGSTAVLLVLPLVTYVITNTLSVDLN